MRHPSKEKENHKQKSTARNKYIMFGNNEYIHLAVVKHLRKGITWNTYNVDKSYTRRSQNH